MYSLVRLHLVIKSFNDSFVRSRAGKRDTLCSDFRDELRFGPRDAGPATVLLRESSSLIRAAAH